MSFWFHPFVILIILGKWGFGGEKTGCLPPIWGLVKGVGGSLEGPRSGGLGEFFPLYYRYPMLISQGNFQIIDICGHTSDARLMKNILNSGLTHLEIIHETFDP